MPIYPIRVAVLRSCSKGGPAVCRAVQNANDMFLLACFDPAYRRKDPVGTCNYGDMASMWLDALPDVAVLIGSVGGDIVEARDRCIHCVVSTQPIDKEAVKWISDCFCSEVGSSCILVDSGESVDVLAAIRAVSGIRGFVHHSVLTTTGN